MSPLLAVVLIVLIIAALPTWPYSMNWGYYPGGGLTLLLIVLLAYSLTRRTA